MRALSLCIRDLVATTQSLILPCPSGKIELRGCALLRRV